MTTLQLAILAGGLIGLGLWLLLWRFLPTRPDLGAYLERFTPARTANAEATRSPLAGDTRDRLGHWLISHTPILNLFTPPQRELNMLRIPLHRFYAEKALFAVVGMVFPTLAYVVASLLGLPLPFYVPLVVSLAVGAAAFFVPNLNLREQASTARVEFAHGLGAYVDLLALERAAGIAQRQSMEMAAEVGDSWVFRRIGEELRRSRWSGVPPWDSLKALSEELDVPDLADIADIMRTSGEDGAAVVETLRARATSMRVAQQAREITIANAAAEKLVIPLTSLLGVYMLMIAAPVGLRFLLGV